MVNLYVPNYEIVTDNITPNFAGQIEPSTDYILLQPGSNTYKKVLFDNICIFTPFDHAFASLTIFSGQQVNATFTLFVRNVAGDIKFLTGFPVVIPPAAGVRVIELCFSPGIVNSVQNPSSGTFVYEIYMDTASFSISGDDILIFRLNTYADTDPIRINGSVYLSYRKYRF